MTSPFYAYYSVVTSYFPSIFFLVPASNSSRVIGPENHFAPPPIIFEIQKIFLELRIIKY